MIAQLDPFVVLQYISSSIDVIINLKFEDIEKKIRTKEAANDMFNEVEAVSLSSQDFTKDPKNSAVQDGPGMILKPKNKPPVSYSERANS
jgi:hypothetical protein